MLICREHPRRRSSFKCLTILCVAAGLSACAGDDLADLKSYVAEVKARQKSAVEPLPEIKTVEPFVFNAEDMRDPFVPSEKAEQQEEVKAENGIRPDTARAKEELESYELDTLRFVGTVNLNNALWGLIRASDGTIHRVHAGNYMGRNFGKIIRIKEDQIELLEIIPDSPGAWRERKASLDLAEASGEKR
jgi:type IV pilus assembly protein PilP